MKLFAILKKDLLILFHSRAEMAVLFLMPLAFIIPISIALGSGDGYGLKRNNNMILLPVVNYDQGPHAQRLVTAIGESFKLEFGYDPKRVASVGLQDEPDCTTAALAAESMNATATVESLTTQTISLAPSGTAKFTPTTKILTLTPGTGTPNVTTGTPQTTPTVRGTPVKRGATPTAASPDNTNPTAAAKNIARCDEIVARAMLQRSWRSALLIIPEGFSKDIDAGKPVQAALIYDPASDAIQMQQIEGVVKGATIRLSLQNQVSGGLNQLSDLVAFAPDNIRKSVKQQAGAPPPSNQNPAVSLEKGFPTNYQLKQTPDTYQQTIPGYTVMYVFFIITSLSSSIRQERLNGTFRRLLSLPVSRSDLLGGKMLATAIIGLIQVFILFGVGAVAFKLNLGNDPLAFLLLTVALVLAATAMGLAASTTRINGGALAAPLIIAALLGGCMFPLDLMPPFLRTLSLIVPHSWALTGYQNLMVRGQGLQEVFPQIMVLLGFAALFFYIAIRRFDFESQEAG